MAKKEKQPEALEEVVQETKEKKGSRETRWKTFLEAAKAQNPVKYASKEDNGEFKNIPENF